MQWSGIIEDPERIYLITMERNTISKVFEYPVLPLDGKIAFPDISISLELLRRSEIKAFEEAYRKGSKILLLPQKDPYEENPGADGFHSIGTVAKVAQLIRKSDNKVRILFNSLQCAEVVNIFSDESGGFWKANCKLRRRHRMDPADTKAYLDEAREYISTYIDHMKHISKASSGFAEEIDQIDDVQQMAEFLAANLLETYDEKLSIYLERNPKEKLSKVLSYLLVYIEAFEIRKRVHDKVKARADRNQKEYYLNEQLRAIHEELGDDGESETEEYKKQIMASAMPDDAKARLVKEAGKLAKMPMNSAEYNVICNYIEACLELPWGVTDEDRIDLPLAEKILDRDHYGLEKVKERIVEYLAVRKLTPNVKNQIICLVGPPGTGKTSIVRSVAEAMGRRYVRVSLGGVRDEADIRGHRKTYIGSMPGRILDGIRRAETKNPVMLLDEIDKLTRDSHGDPASALMEVLDSEQNKEFRDHFIEFPFDLSEVMFIATANSLDTVPRPLLDRMEVIELKSYSTEEKLSIAKKHLIPKQLKRHGLDSSKLKFSSAAIKTIINSYTREAGVRNLEREIASVCRKAAKKLVGAEVAAISITPKNISEFLGSQKIMPETVSATNEVGVVNGLAYTELGGALLKVEVASMPGTGKVELTGSLGDVMKESAKAAVTYIRSHCGEWNIESDFYTKKDIHIHFPEGAVPKDGPSAGVTMVSALVSELSGRAVKSSVAMTGEVTLKGKVLAIGGLKEKTMAAYNAGVKTVLLPKENLKDLDDIDKTVRASLEFIPCSTVADVLRNAIV